MAKTSSVLQFIGAVMMIGGILLTLFARAIAEASGGAYFDIGLMMYGVVIAGLGVVVLIVSRWFKK